MLLLLPLTFGGSLLAQNRSVSFEDTTLAVSLAKAKAANKLIFFDGYATWCGPCKYMSNTVFKQDKVADFFNANFVNVKFDMEKGEGIELAKTFGATDGHKFVNGVLDKLAPRLRAAELRGAKR